jgi:hypothetical protein
LADDYDLKNVELTPIEEYVFPPQHERPKPEPPRRII